MSLQDDNLRRGLQQYLDNIKEVDENTDLLRDLVEWLVLELQNIEFSEFMAAEPFKRSEDRQ